MTVKLPRHLAVWEPQLHIFPEEIALALGAMAQKIAALVGPFAHHHEEGRVAPDGFAGLAKRGTYERLIASDWLLADELPEEFMRRSVMGEHLFWKLAFREPAQSRSTLVLFDAGPEQLGAPRLLHLAALAVFSTRARLANANFNWGILQLDSEVVLPGSNNAEVEYLLGARGSMSADAFDFQAWSSRAIELGRNGEVWFVGSERLRRFVPENFSGLLIADSNQPNERKLLVECRPAGKHARRIELELPPAALCAQALRDPFAVRTALTRTFQLHPNLRGPDLAFPPSGRRLYSRVGSDTVVALSPTHAPPGWMGKPKRYSMVGRRPITAIGQARRTTIAVSFDPISLSFHVKMFGKELSIAEGEYVFEDEGQKPIFMEDVLHVCVVQDCPWGRGKQGIYLVDDSYSLLKLFQNEKDKVCRIVAPGTFAITQYHDQFFNRIRYATYERLQPERVVISSPVQSPSSHSLRLTGVPREGFFGYASSNDNSGFGLFATGYEDDAWEIFTSKTQTRLTVPERFGVCGVLNLDGYGERLIVIEEDGQTLSLFSPHDIRRLVKAPERIIAAAASHALPLIAYATESGRVGVYSLEQKSVVINFERRKP